MRVVSSIVVCLYALLTTIILIVFCTFHDFKKMFGKKLTTTFQREINLPYFHSQSGSNFSRREYVSSIISFFHFVQ